MSLLGISKKGKWIVGGVALFAVIATASTGLAAWVIGENTNGTHKGNIAVETVQDRSCEVKISNTSELTVKFGPCVADTSKNSTPVISPSTGENEEDLTFKIDGTLNADGYGKVAVTIENTSVEITDGDTKTTKKLSEFVSGNYITMPTDFAEVKDGENVTGWKREFTVINRAFTTDEISFGWGSLTETENPVNHFTTYAAAKTYLNELYTLNNMPFNITVAPIYGA